MPGAGRGTAVRNGEHREQTHERRRGPSGERLARALGVASVALGASLVAGRPGRASGLDDTPGTRAVARGGGVREFAAAAAILPRSGAAGVWSRTGRDAWTGAAGTGDEPGGERSPGGIAGAMAGIAAVDAVGAVRAGKRLDPRKAAEDGALPSSAGVTVNRSADDAYALWRDFSRLPAFMAHLESVSDERQALDREAARRRHRRVGRRDRRGRAEPARWPGARCRTPRCPTPATVTFEPGPGRPRHRGPGAS